MLRTNATVRLATCAARTVANSHPCSMTPRPAVHGRACGVATPLRLRRVTPSANRNAPVAPPAELRLVLQGTRFVVQEAGGTALGESTIREYGGRYLARAPRTTPRERPWTVARTDKRSWTSVWRWRGGVGAEVSSEPKRRAEATAVCTSRYAGQRSPLPGEQGRQRSGWRTQMPFHKPAQRFVPLQRVTNPKPP